MLLGAAGLLPSGWAQTGLTFRPVMIPELTLQAMLGSSNTLQVANVVGETTNWQNVATFRFTNTTMVVLDLSGGLVGSRFYRLVPAGSGGSTPPFSPPLATLVWIAPGQFWMGSPASDPDATSSEEPLTLVTLSQGFFMSKFTTTQGEYRAVTGQSPSYFGGDDNLPVESVTWHEATNYCGLLNAQEQAAGRLPSGYAYRLPTEAEWEYAARAGSTNRFSYGDDLAYSQVGDYFWYSGNSDGTTHAVGSKKVNSWGLYDLGGNVSEWCGNWDYIYPGGEVTDPVGPATGEAKVFRGASFGDGASDTRPAARRSIEPNTSFSFFGFRVVLAPAGTGMP